ncbi:MAG: DoxX family protein [Candidatus Binatia bacterium]
MEQAFLPAVEAVFRVLLGLRFLSSGVSNIRRWPNATRTAGLVFSRGTTFFGFVATTLMVTGGSGLAVGFQTPIAALMLIIFLIPTFQVHRRHLQDMPDIVEVIKANLTEDEAKTRFRVIERQATHSHEIGWQTNVVLLAANLFFVVRGCTGFGLDSLIEDWVIRLL